MITAYVALFSAWQFCHVRVPQTTSTGRRGEPSAGDPLCVPGIGQPASAADLVRCPGGQMDLPVAEWILFHPTACGNAAGRHNGETFLARMNLNL